MSPEQLSLALFVNGYGSDKYGTTHEGFELEQSVATNLGLVARASAYQIYQGTGFDSPLLPASRSSTRNFGRFQGGIDITPLPGVSLTLLRGEDIGDSHAPVVEGNFSSWILPHSLHPINFSFSGSHYYENEVTSGRIDLRAILLSTAEVMLLGGVGGAIWVEARWETPKDRAGQTSAFSLDDGTRVLTCRLAMEARTPTAW